MENIEELIRLFKEKPIFFPIGYVYIKKPIIIKETSKKSTTIAFGNVFMDSGNHYKPTSLISI